MRRNRDLERWAMERREEVEQVDLSEVYGRVDPTGQVMDGWAGISVSSSNNERGVSVVEIDVRPVLLGRVEVRVKATSRKPGAGKDHSKTLYVSATPEAIRDFAGRLMRCAELAERNKLKPRPV